MINVSGPMYYSNYAVKIGATKININLFGDHHFSKKNQCSGDSNSYHIAELPFHLAKVLSRYGQTLDYYLESPYYLQRAETGKRFEISPYDASRDLRAVLLRRLGFDPSVTAGDYVFTDQYLSRSFSKEMLETPLIQARRQVYHCLECHGYLRQVSRELPYREGDDLQQYIDSFHQAMKNRCGSYYEHCRPNLRIHVNDIRDGIHVTLPGESRVFNYYGYFSVIMGHASVYNLVESLSNLPKTAMLKTIVDNYSVIGSLDTNDARCKLTALLWQTFNILEDNGVAMRWFISDVDTRQLYDAERQTIRQDYVTSRFSTLTREQQNSRDFKFLRDLTGCTVYFLARRILLAGRSSEREPDSSNKVKGAAAEILAMPWLWQYLTSLRLETLVELQESRFSPQAVLDWMSAHGGSPIVEFINGSVDGLIGNIYDFEVDTRNIKRKCHDLKDRDRCHVDPDVPGDNILTHFFNIATNPFLNRKIHDRELNHQFITAIRRFKGHCLRQIRGFKYPSPIGDTTMVTRARLVERFRVRFFLEMERKSDRESMFVKFREMSDSILKSYSLVMDFYTVMRVSRKMCHKYLRHCMQPNSYPVPYNQPQPQDNILYYAGAAHIEAFEQFLKFLNMESDVDVTRNGESHNKITYVHPTIPGSETLEIGDETGLSRLMSQGYEPVRCQSVRREWLTGIASEAVPPRSAPTTPAKPVAVTVEGVELDRDLYDGMISELGRLDRDGVGFVVNPPPKRDMTPGQLSLRSDTFSRIKSILPDELASDPSVRTRFRLAMIKLATGITKD